MAPPTRFIRHEKIAFMNVADCHDIKDVHERHSVGVCPWCDEMRVRNISDEFLRRLEVCDERIEELVMWSLGTSLKCSKYNRKILLKFWRIFSRRINRSEDWNPVFRVVETGRRGFLHIHVAVSGFASHAHICKVWRSVTGEASNVNFSRADKDRGIPTLIRYLVKYLTKEGSTYRWMGPFYGLGDRSRSIRGAPGVVRVHCGANGLGYRVRAYAEKPPAQRKLLNAPEFVP